MNSDILSLVILKTNFEKPYFLVSKLFYYAYKHAISIKALTSSTINLKIKNKFLSINLEYREPDGFGLIVSTSEKKRFFKVSFVRKNNLCVDKNITLSIKKKFLKCQLFDNKEYIYIKTMRLPEDYNFIF